MKEVMNPIVVLLKEMKSFFLRNSEIIIANFEVITRRVDTSGVVKHSIKIFRSGDFFDFLFSISSSLINEYSDDFSMLLFDETLERFLSISDIH